jgi:hypothetical protein
MHVIIEGMDNSGKSTLAKYLQAGSRNNWLIQESEGPGKDAFDIIDRIERYSIGPPTLFARHPAVSQPIYNVTRKDPITIPAKILEAFYASGHLFIYCEAGQRGLQGHVAKDTDTSELLQQIWENRYLIASAYRDWAVARAHIVYRIGDDMRQVLKMVEGAMT